MERARASETGQEASADARLAVVGDALSARELEALQVFAGHADILYVDSADEAWRIARQGEADTIVIAAGAEEISTLLSRSTEMPEGVRVIVRMEPGSNGQSGAEGGRFLLLRTSTSLGSLLEDSPRLAAPGNGFPQEKRNGVPDLGEVRKAVTRVHHDINNPLSIVSGNAQLLLELARAMQLDEDLVQPVRDIEEASRRIAGLMQMLADLAIRLSPHPPEVH